MYKEKDVNKILFIFNITTSGLKRSSQRHKSSISSIRIMIRNVLPSFFFFFPIGI